MVTSSTTIRDQLVLLGLHAGMSPHFVADVAQQTLWRVSFGAKVEPSVNQSEGVRRVSYDGRTWCVSVPTGLIVARRARSESGIIQAASRPLVIGNCMRGVSRSASIVLAWLIRNKNLNVPEALEFLQSKRAIADPNEGFMEQLEGYYRKQVSVRGGKSEPSLTRKDLHIESDRNASVPNMYHREQSSESDSDVVGEFVIVDVDTNVEPSKNFRYSGMLYLKLGRRRRWKKRFFHIDADTGYLYWWSKPDEEVIGSFNLTNCVLTTLPTPECCFRLNIGANFRDFRAENEEEMQIWMKHLSDEIVSRSGIKQSSESFDAKERVEEII